MDDENVPVDVLSNGAFDAFTGDSVGVAMPMTVESVEIYLGIVLAGCVVVSM